MKFGESKGLNYLSNFTCRIGTKDFPKTITITKGAQGCDKVEPFNYVIKPKVTNRWIISNR